MNRRLYLVINLVPLLLGLLFLTWFVSHVRDEINLAYNETLRTVKECRARDGVMAKVWKQGDYRCVRISELEQKK